MKTIYKLLPLSLIFLGTFLTVCKNGPVNPDDDGDNEKLPIPAQENPPDQAIRQRLLTRLTWRCEGSSDRNLKYDVYFSKALPLQRLSENQKVYEFDPDKLDPDQQYSWQIVAKDSNGDSTVSPVWSFRTGNEFQKSFPTGNLDVPMVMTWIPSGRYMMGAPGTVGAGDDEAPSHEVLFSRGVWMGIYEVTQAQWIAVKGNKQFSRSGQNLPADNVSWNEAKSFISALNDLESGAPWRLPTEAEWEYACRAGHYKTRFWWGNDFNYSELENHAWFQANSGNHVHEVGTTAGATPNPWGLWDMHGNLWEWSEDWYHWGYEGAPSDGSAWIDPQGTQRILRGGAWSYPGRQCLPTLRSMYYTGQTIGPVGFRVVRED